MHSKPTSAFTWLCNLSKVRPCYNCSEPMATPAANNKSSPGYYPSCRSCRNCTAALQLSSIVTSNQVTSSSPPIKRPSSSTLASPNSTTPIATPRQSSEPSQKDLAPLNSTPARLARN